MALCKHPFGRLGADLSQLGVNLGATLGELVAHLVKRESSSSVFLTQVGTNIALRPT